MNAEICLEGSQKNNYLGVLKTAEREANWIFCCFFIQILKNFKSVGIMAQ